MTLRYLLLIASSLLAGCTTPDQPAGLPHQRANTYEPGHVLFFHIIAMAMLNPASPASNADTTSTAAIDGFVASQCKELPLPAMVRLTGATPYPGSGVAHTVMADAKGEFKFNNIPGGSYLLSATYRGYGALADTILQLGSTERAVLTIGLGCPAPAPH